jgi:hypothetical protein
MCAFLALEACEAPILSVTALRRTLATRLTLCCCLSCKRCCNAPVASPSSSASTPKFPYAKASSLAVASWRESRGSSGAGRLGHPQRRHVSPGRGRASDAPMFCSFTLQILPLTGFILDRSRITSSTVLDLAVSFALESSTYPFEFGRPADEASLRFLDDVPT